MRHQTPGQLFNIPPKEELRIVLDIVVRFPSQLANLRAMGTLDTNLPWFYHEMGEMDDHLTFESISLTTSDSGIRSGVSATLL